MAGIFTISRICAERGNLILGSYGDSLCLCIWEDAESRQKVIKRLQRILDADMTPGTSPVIDMATKQLKEYFMGKRTTFDIPIIFAGTDFQKSVWDYLPLVKYGSCESYGTVAKNIGAPKSVRAVANACNANALHIIIPCHRVIAHDGKLSGYAGGTDKKRLLLDMEQYVVIHDDKVRPA